MRVVTIFSLNSRQERDFPKWHTVHSIVGHTTHKQTKIFWLSKYEKTFILNCCSNATHCPIVWHFMLLSDAQRKLSSVNAYLITNCRDKCKPWLSKSAYVNGKRKDAGVWFHGLKCGQTAVLAKYNHITLNYQCDSLLSFTLVDSQSLLLSLTILIFNNIGFLFSLLPPPDLSLWLHQNSPSQLWHFLAYPVFITGLVGANNKARESRGQCRRLACVGTVVEGKRSICLASWVWETLRCCSVLSGRQDI